MEGMSTNRHIIWGIGLSLVVHGILFGLPWSPQGQYPVPLHRKLPLEITLVGPNPREDVAPEPKPVPQIRPKVVQQPISAHKIKVMRKKEKPPAVVQRKPTLIRDESPIPPEEEISPNQPESVSPAPQREIVPPNLQGVEEKGGKPRFVAPEGSVHRENVEANLIPKGGDSAKSDRIIMARPRYDRNPKPLYPRLARRRGYEGLVVLRVEILPDGRVGEVRVERSSGHHILDKSALKTVKKWKFIPARRGDDPIRIWAEVPIKFDLE